MSVTVILIFYIFVLEIIFIEGEEALTKYGDEAQNGAVELFISD